MLLALQMEYMKCCCFLCLWEVDSLSFMSLKTGQPEKTLAPGAASTTGKVGAYEELR